ncbi:hypothetical protein AB1N83_011316 [Pleurotus pulmonarius]
MTIFGWTDVSRRSTSFKPQAVGRRTTVACAHLIYTRPICSATLRTRIIYQCPLSDVLRYTVILGQGS